jgi:hypothetical protein
MSSAAVCSYNKLCILATQYFLARLHLEKMVDACSAYCKVLIFQARGFPDELDSHSVVRILVACSYMFAGMCSSSKHARSC